MYTNGTCPRCGANLVYSARIDVDEDPVLGITIEDINIKEILSEDEFVEFLAESINKQLEAGVIQGNIKDPLITQYGISPTYAERLEQKIISLLTTTPQCIEV